MSRLAYFRGDTCIPSGRDAVPPHRPLTRIGSESLDERIGLDILPGTWVRRASCGDPGQRSRALVAIDDFYPSRGGRGLPFESKQALRMCTTCPVSGMCLEDAIQFEASSDYTDLRLAVQGIRGGMTANERRPLVAAERRRAS